MYEWNLKIEETPASQYNDELISELLVHVTETAATVRRKILITAEQM